MQSNFIKDLQPKGYGTNLIQTTKNEIEAANLYKFRIAKDNSFPFVLFLVKLPTLAMAGGSPIEDLANRSTPQPF